MPRTMSQEVRSLKVLKRSSNDASIELLQELKQIAPDIWESRKKRRLILTQKLGGLEKPE